MKTAHAPEIPLIPSAKIAIVQSKWYREYTDLMVSKAVALLKQAQAAEPEIHVVSGCLEIPLTAQRLARSGNGYEAIIALGIVVKGETLHFEMIINECIRGIGHVMLGEDIPIIVEVLPVLSIDHAKARSADDEFNKGIEAAVATAETVAWRRKHPASKARALGFGG